MKSKKTFGLLLAATLAGSSALYAQSYCTSLGGNCTIIDNINDVELIGTTLINLNTHCANLTGASYSVYPATGNTTATLTAGNSYQLVVTIPAPSRKTSVWIDYNQDFVFDASEWTQVALSSTDSVPDTCTFTVPSNALPGATRMRIRSRASLSSNGPNDACTSFATGETEDYTVTIINTGGASIQNPENQAQASLQIYPDPATSYFILCFNVTDNTGRDVVVSVYDLPGNKVCEENIGRYNKGYYRKRIEAGALKLSPGIYFVRLNSGRGQVARVVIAGE